MSLLMAVFMDLFPLRDSPDVFATLDRFLVFATYVMFPVVSILTGLMAGYLARTRTVLVALLASAPVVFFVFVGPISALGILQGAAYVMATVASALLVSHVYLGRSRLRSQP